jgi:two-component system OmpR family response regulator
MGGAERRRSGLALTIAASAADARIAKVEILKTEPTFPDGSSGDVGSYERLAGWVARRAVSADLWRGLITIASGANALQDLRDFTAPPSVLIQFCIVCGRRASLYGLLRARNRVMLQGRRIPHAQRHSHLMNILLVEDDLENASFVKERVEELGHSIELAANGRQGLRYASKNRYDAIVLDRMLPDLGGIDLVKMIRRAGVETPVLFLTNVAGIDDRVEGLESGGDDYLVKPYAFSELMARLGALARRSPSAEVRTILAVADLEMDLIRRSVHRAGNALDLLPREFQLLEYMLRNEGRVLTRTMLLEHVWDFHFDPQTKIVETHISRLRAKVDRGRGPELIHTLRGVGYSLRVPT